MLKCAARLGEQDVLFARLLAAILQDDVGARDVLRVEPCVVEARRLERQLVVLVVVLADEDLCAVWRLEVEGAGGLVVVLLLGLGMLTKRYALSQRFKYMVQ